MNIYWAAQDLVLKPQKQPLFWELYKVTERITSPEQSWTMDVLQRGSICSSRLTATGVNSDKECLSGESPRLCQRHQSSENQTKLQQSTTNKEFQNLNSPSSPSCLLWTVLPQGTTWKQSNNQIMPSPYNYITHLFHYTKKLAFLLMLYNSLKMKLTDKMKQALWILLSSSSETSCFRSTCVMAFGTSYTSWLKTASYLERGNFEN